LAVLDKNCSENPNNFWVNLGKKHEKFGLSVIFQPLKAEAAELIELAGDAKLIIWQPVAQRANHARF